VIKPPKTADRLEIRVNCQSMMIWRGRLLSEQQRSATAASLPGAKLFCNSFDLTAIQE
jgi:hypothetical protein